MSPSPERPSPAIAGREVWFFAAVPWDFSLAGRTRYLALGLKALGARVTFVERPTIRQALARLRRPLRAAELPVVTLPPSEPRLDRLPAAPRALDALARRGLERALGKAQPIAVVSTPRWAPVLEGLWRGPVFYDCIDDLGVHAPEGLVGLYSAWERQLLARAAGALAVSPALASALSAAGAADVRLCRNGVGVDEFLSRALPADPRGPRKRVGYLGAVFEWVDVALLAAVAKALPEHDFEIIGPVRRGVDVRALQRLPNVHLTGFRPYPLVPRAMASFDVALIPFKEGEVARAADPIKVYEYFCFGTPVVTTPVGDLERIGDLLYVASGARDFTAAVRAALEEHRPDLRDRRVAYARANDWSVRALELAEALLPSGEASVAPLARPEPRG